MAIVVVAVLTQLCFSYRLMRRLFLKADIEVEGQTSIAY